MMRIAAQLGLGLLAFLSAVHVFAFSIPAAPESYVNDYAHMLSPQEKDHLNQELADFEKTTSNQLVIVTIPSLDNQPIEDYSIKLAERWKIGTHEKNNGIILLLSKAEHRIRIEVGYGLEGALPDAIASQIISNEMRGPLTQGHFDEGVDKGVQAIIAATKNEYHASTNSPPLTLGAIINIIFISAFVIYFILIFIGAIRRGIYRLSGLNSRIHTPFWDYIAAMSTHSGGGSGGSGGGFSGGGFSGGGGGFGGGGASGGW